MTKSEILNKGKKKKINVSKYKKKANPNAPLTAAKQFTEATEAAAKKTEELEIEIIEIEDDIDIIDIFIEND